MASNEEKIRLDKLFENQRMEQLKLAAMEKKMRDDLRTEVKANHYQELKEKAKPVWDEFYKLIDEIIHRSMTGYDSFQSATSSMFQFCQKHGDAMRAQAPIALGQLVDFVSGDNIVGFVLAPLGSQIAQTVNDAVFGHAVEVDYYIDFVKDKDANGKELETGYVGTQNLARRDGQKLTPDQVLAFEACVVAWLDMKGYTPATPKGDPSIFIDKKDRTPLTAKQFAELRPDFEKFLSKGNEIKAKLDDRKEREPVSPLRPNP